MNKKEQCLVSAKDIIVKLRDLEIKKQEAENKAKKEEELRKRTEEQLKLIKNPCELCKQTIKAMDIHSHNIISDLEILKQMYKTGSYTFKVDGLHLTRDDLEARIIVNKCSLNNSKNAYNKCCKEMIAPTDKLFKC